ncbi:MAG: Fur family transcriptional regulator [Acidimicrobiales bacterium]
MRSPDELNALFRARSLKVTPQRQCIFRVLHGNEAHPTAESVYAAAKAEMPMISLKTVYQTLNDLAEMGEIALLDLGTGSSRFDPNVEDPHHHLVCEECGKVRDLNADFGRLEVPPALRQGFTLGAAEVVFRGRCADCAACAAAAEGRTAAPAG